MQEVFAVQVLARPPLPGADQRRHQAPGELVRGARRGAGRRAGGAAGPTKSARGSSSQETRRPSDVPASPISRDRPSRSLIGRASPSTPHPRGQASPADSVVPLEGRAVKRIDGVPSTSGTDGRGIWATGSAAAGCGRPGPRAESAEAGPAPAGGSPAAVDVHRHQHARYGHQQHPRDSAPCAGRSSRPTWPGEPMTINFSLRSSARPRRSRSAQLLMPVEMTTAAAADHDRPGRGPAS